MKVFQSLEVIIVFFSLFLLFLLLRVFLFLYFSFLKEISTKAFIALSQAGKGLALALISTSNYYVRSTYNFHHSRLDNFLDLKLETSRASPFFVCAMLKAR